MLWLTTTDYSLLSKLLEKKTLESPSFELPQKPDEPGIPRLTPWLFLQLVGWFGRLLFFVDGFCRFCYFFVFLDVFWWWWLGFLCLLNVLDVFWRFLNVFGWFWLFLKSDALFWGMVLCFWGQKLCFEVRFVVFEVGCTVLRSDLLFLRSELLFWGQICFFEVGCLFFEVSWCQTRSTWTKMRSTYVKWPLGSRRFTK